MQIATITYPSRAQPTVNTYGSSGRVLRQVASDGQRLEIDYHVSGACVAHLDTPYKRCTGPKCPRIDSLAAQKAGWRFYGGTIVLKTPTSSQSTDACFVAAPFPTLMGPVHIPWRWKRCCRSGIFNLNSTSPRPSLAAATNPDLRL